MQHLEELKAKYEQENQTRLADIRERNAEVDELEEEYRNGEPGAVTAFFSMVLESANYPEGFPQDFRMAFVPAAKELVIDYELPVLDVVPKIAEYRYVKPKDTIEPKPRKLSEIKDVYQDVVSGITLRTIHEA